MARKKTQITVGQLFLSTPAPPKGLTTSMRAFLQPFAVGYVRVRRDPRLEFKGVRGFRPRLYAAFETEFRVPRLLDEEERAFKLRVRRRRRGLILPDLLWMVDMMRYRKTKGGLWRPIDIFDINLEPRPGKVAPAPEPAWNPREKEAKPSPSTARPHGKVKVKVEPPSSPMRPRGKAGKAVVKAEPTPSPLPRSSPSPHSSSPISYPSSVSSSPSSSHSSRETTDVDATQAFARYARLNAHRTRDEDLIVAEIARSGFPPQQPDWVGWGPAWGPPWPSTSQDEPWPPSTYDDDDDDAHPYGVEFN